jgi:DmsE family decaheme c-type cytochrome
MHDSEGLACSDCHNPMTRTSPTGLLRESSVNRTCFSCHPAQRVEFRKRSHMPLLEGKIHCNDCHEPHGSVTDPLLRTSSTFELCTSCHPDKRGPFIWEHAPVTEDCTICHLPHGSNRASLLTSSPPCLCQQCHAQIGLANHPIALMTSDNLASGRNAPARDARIIGRGCVTCHAQIHGSNHPSGARFHR